MDEIKAVSPEVQGLFDTVRKQAGEFSRAFELFEEKSRELNKLSEQAEKFLYSIRHRFDEIVSGLKDSIRDDLEMVEHKVERSEKIYDELDNIRVLRDSMSELYLKLKDQSAALEKQIGMSFPELEAELEKTAAGLKADIGKELEAASQKVDLKSSLRLKQMETRISTLNQKLLMLNETQTREYSDLADSIESLRGKIAELSFPDTVKDAAESLAKEKDELSQLANSVREVIDGYDRQKEEAANLSYIEPGRYEMDRKRIDRQLDKMERDLQKLKKLAIISVAAAAILLVAFLVVTFIL